MVDQYIWRVRMTDGSVYIVAQMNGGPVYMIGQGDLWTSIYGWSVWVVEQYRSLVRVSGGPVYIVG